MKPSVIVITLACLLIPALSPAGELANLWQKQKEHKPATQPAAKAADAHDVTEIGIERTMCFGTCPVYTLIIKSDGTFRYHGELYVQRKGDFTGSISKEQFQHLAKQMIDCGFASLADRYYFPETDNPTVYTMGIIKGDRKIILDYAGEGPRKLRDLEGAISAALDGAKWDGSKK